MKNKQNIKVKNGDKKRIKKYHKIQVGMAWMKI